MGPARALTLCMRGARVMRASGFCAFESNDIAALTIAFDRVALPRTKRTRRDPRRASRLRVPSRRLRTAQDQALARVAREFDHRAGVRRAFGGLTSRGAHRALDTPH